MARQLNVNDDREILEGILKNCLCVADGVSCHTSHSRGFFALVIQGQIAPPEWAITAFALRARRHDAGYGDKSQMIWIFPVTFASRIIAHLPTLIKALEAVRHQEQNEISQNYSSLLALV